MSVLTESPSAIDRLHELGGEVWLDGKNLKIKHPETPEGRSLLEQIRKDADAIRFMLAEQSNKAPSETEVRALLPEAVKVVAYRPKEVPFEVRPCSIVTNAGAFFRAYLHDLRDRVERPSKHVGPSLETCIQKLSDAGLTLKFDSEVKQ